MRLVGLLSAQTFPPHPTPPTTCRANPVWLDPFCRNLELAAQAEHEDDLPENLSEIADLWNSPTRTHVSTGQRQGPGWTIMRDRVEAGEVFATTGPETGPVPRACVHVLPTSGPAHIPSPQGTFGREPAAVKPDDDRYLRAAIQEYDNIAKLGQIIREGPIKVSCPYRLPHSRPQKPASSPLAQLGCPSEAVRAGGS